MNKHNVVKEYYTHRTLVEHSHRPTTREQGVHFLEWNKASPIVRMIQSLADYADAHRELYGSGIGEDYVLGPEWANMVQGCRGLLNGETGQLDCGTLDGLLCDMLRAEGLYEH